MPRRVGGVAESHLGILAADHRSAWASAYNTLNARRCIQGEVLPLNQEAFFLAPPVVHKAQP